MSADLFKMVAEALDRPTDGSLTFHMAEDEHCVVAAYRLDGPLVAHAWPKWQMADYLGADYVQAFVDRGVHDLLAKGNDR